VHLASSHRYNPPNPTRRSTRVSHIPNWYAFSSTLSTISAPTCYSQVCQNEYLQKAMDEELFGP